MKLSDRHITLIAETASQEAIKAYKAQSEKEEKAKHDRRLRNIKLLLRNYRKFVKHCNDVKVDISELRTKLDLDEIDTDGFEIKSILHSKEKTLAMVKYIDRALNVYETICFKSVDPEDQRRCQVVHDMYIYEVEVTANELATGHLVHPRTIYKDIDKACETLAVLMFGVDGVKLR